MIWLLDLVDEHRAAVRYDLLRHGYRLEWLATDRLPWGDAVAILTQQPPGSAVHRAQYPHDWDRDATVQTLEILAVLSSHISDAVRGVDPEAWATKFSDLVEQPKPEPTGGLDLQMIDQLMGW